MVSVVAAFFFFFWLHHMVCRILVSQPRTEPTHLHWKCRVLTTGPQGSPSVFVDRQVEEGMKRRFQKQQSLT